MSATFTWAFRDARLHLAGRIDENADLAALSAEIPAGGATLDLSELTRINSIGVREWMDFVAATGDRPLALERCAPVFVDQLNAIANFAGAAKITSVMAAFECLEHGDVQLVEALIADLHQQRWPSTPRCPHCGTEMAPTQERELYYRFLRYL